MKVVLALHGFLGLPSDWNQIQKEFHQLQNNYKLVPIDYMNLRGLTPDVNLERWGENFNLWAEKNYPRVEKVLAGYSLGGRLALHALQSNCKIWSKACFLSTNLGMPTELEKKIKLELDQRWSQRFQSTDFETVVREWNSQPVFKNSQSDLSRKADDYDSEVLARALHRWSLGRQNDFSQSEIFRRIPSLWLVGAYDDRFLNELDRLPRNGTLVKSKIIENASHRLLFDGPQKVAEALHTFLNL